MKFRKKPVIVEAVQFDPLDKHKIDLPEGVVGIPSPNSDNWSYEGCKFYINVYGRTVEVFPGYWIVTEDFGYVHPVKPDVFEEKYELMGE
jgi:hypothetical protein